MAAVIGALRVAAFARAGFGTVSDHGLICTGETYKSVVKLTFAKGASLADWPDLLNASLEGNSPTESPPRLARTY